MYVFSYSISIMFLTTYVWSEVFNYKSTNWNMLISDLLIFFNCAEIYVLAIYIHFWSEYNCHNDNDDQFIW